MGLFERFLSLWVALCIILGIILGMLIPETIQAISSFEYAKVNLVVAVLIWVMIYPMMVQIDFRSLRQISQRPQGLLLTVIVNWLIKPFTMAALAIVFFHHIYAGFVSKEDADSYIAGLILLGVAPCTAMVFVWSHLTKGDPNYTLIQVALNDVIMIFAFAPIVALLLGTTNIEVPWDTLGLSVILYVLIPLIVGFLTRQFLQNRGSATLTRFSERLKPFSILGLLSTIVLLFAFQAHTIVNEPFIVFLIAIPLLIQSYGIFAISYFWAYFWRLPHKIAAPAALIGTSNFFELAVAVAIGLFGLQSGAALATVVGVLIEVPVMLSLVSLSNRTIGLFERRELA